MSERVPYVGMDVLFTAVKDSLSGGRLQSEREGGMILTSDPVHQKAGACNLIYYVKQATVRRAGNACRR